jgi:hypothetical protein
MTASAAAPRKALQSGEGGAAEAVTVTAPGN